MTRVIIEIKLFYQYSDFFLEILEVFISVEYKILTTQEQTSEPKPCFSRCVGLSCPIRSALTSLALKLLWFLQPSKVEDPAYGLGSQPHTQLSWSIILL